MKNFYNEQPNGYEESIQRGLSAVPYLGRNMTFGNGSQGERIAHLKDEIDSADAIVIGAGAGLSTAAGMTYSGERFERYFYDFAKKYGIRDMYSGGFYPFADEETRWAWWARHIYYNRYVDAPKPVYPNLLHLVEGKDYFVITTNVDHLFQKSGFDKKRLFYTQGDYGLFQEVHPSVPRTYDNEAWVMEAMEAQGFGKDSDGIYAVPEDGALMMRLPSSLIPVSPQGGAKLTMNLRVDNTFAEDEGWHRASVAYADFLRRHDRLHVLYLELGVGSNTPVIIKYPFWQMTLANEKAVYACINVGEAYAPGELADRSICIDADIAKVVETMASRQ